MSLLRCSAAGMLRSPVFGERIYCRGSWGRAHCFHRLVICVSPLPPPTLTSSSLPDQMRPMRTSPLDRSTISCPGNRAGSSSDSKRITPPHIRHCVRPTKGRKKRREERRSGRRVAPSLAFSSSYFCHNNKDLLPSNKNCRQERPHMGNPVPCMSAALVSPCGSEKMKLAT